MKSFCFVATILIAGTALAHEGVKNPAVMARMHAMKEIGTEFKVLRSMVKGDQRFDAEAARIAAAGIAMQAGKAPRLFEAQEDDPKSEALPVIWERYDDFAAKAADLERVALGLAKSMATEDDLIPAVQSLGQSCRACHETYRKKDD